MAFTNQTTHYGLPLPIGSDKSTWLDTNTAFTAIDAAIYQASTDAAAAAGDITTIQGDITSLQSGKQNVLTFDGSPTLGSTNPVTSGGVYNADNAIKIDLAATDLKVSTLEGKIGTTDISGIGDGTITGAIDVLNQGGGSSTPISVNADGVKTYGALLNDLYALIDATKITNNSKVVITDATNEFIFDYSRKIISTGTYNFSSTMITASNTVNIRGVFLDGSSSTFKQFDGTNTTDQSTTVLASGGKIELYY